MAPCPGPLAPVDPSPCPAPQSSEQMLPSHSLTMSRLKKPTSNTLFVTKDIRVREPVVVMIMYVHECTIKGEYYSEADHNG